MKKKTIDNLNLNNKKVLLRVDFNVPMKNGIIQSDKRIIAALPTIKKIISENGKVILLSHLGRIKNEKDKKDNNLEPIAVFLSKKLNKKVNFINKTRGPKLEKAISNMKPGDIVMLQNTRYEDFNENLETKNSLELGKYWASLGDVFINDAFGTCHRAHASNVGIASHISESAIGYLVQKEIEMLKSGLENPKHPFIAIVGGAKVSDKIGVIKNLLKKADKILIGGGMTYTFLKSQGYEIGDSLLEKDFLDMAKEFLKEGKDKIILPIDHATTFSYNDNPRIITQDRNIPKGYMSLDIGDKTIDIYKKHLEGAKTIIWNGPMGVAEFDNFKKGTEVVAKTIAKQKNVFSIIGGGDSAAAAIKLGFENKFTHISTGGGASLQFMEGKKLPGIEIISNN